MSRSKAVLRFWVVGAVALTISISAACEPLLPSMEVETYLPIFRPPLVGV